MDKAYSGEQYKAPKGTGSTNAKMTGKMGKTIVVNFSESTPDFVTVIIQSNRGTIKDTIEIPIDEFLSTAKWIVKYHELTTKEKE